MGSIIEQYCRVFFRINGVKINLMKKNIDFNIKTDGLHEKLTAKIEINKEDLIEAVGIDFFNNLFENKKIEKLENKDG